MPECPVCRKAAARRRIAKCSSCGHRWLPTDADEQREIETSVYSEEYYRDDPVLTASFDALLDREIVPRVGTGSVLDVGCGAGAFLAVARNHGLDAQGIDVSGASEAICRSRGLTAVSGDYLTYNFNGRFDAVTMWDVIEHLRDPRSFFARTRELLTPEGTFFGKVPAFGFLSVFLSERVPRLSGLLLGAPGHVQYFTRSTLGLAAKNEGYRVEWLSPMRSMRGQPAGGSLRKRVARSVLPAYHSLAGDHNLYFAARPQ